MQEMVNDYGFNRSDEKRLETIGYAKKMIMDANASLDQSWMSSTIDSSLKASLVDLKTTYAATTQGKWDVDPQGYFVLDRSDVNLNEIVQVMNKGSAFTTVEAEANLIFIAQAHNAMPFLIDEIERLQWLESELDRVRFRTNQLESLLDSSTQTLSQMRDQIEQMRPLFDDEDGAIQEACDCHDQFNVQLLKSIPA